MIYTKTKTIPYFGKLIKIMASANEVVLLSGVQLIIDVLVNDVSVLSSGEVLELTNSILVVTSLKDYPLRPKDEVKVTITTDDTTTYKNLQVRAICSKK